MTQTSKISLFSDKGVTGYVAQYYHIINAAHKEHFKTNYCVDLVEKH